MRIGKLAAEAGLRPSTVRYYERIGLIPVAARNHGRREFSSDILAHLAVVRFARQCGFTLAETGHLIRGFERRTTASARWAALTATKIQEMDLVIARAKTMKRLLGRIAKCQCETLEECGNDLPPTSDPRIV